MTREQAINYLFSSGFTNEQVGEVVRALTYEPTTKNDSGVDTNKLLADCEKMSFDIEIFNKPLKVVALDAVKNIAKDLINSENPNKSEILTGSTTKNDLGVDCISRADAIRAMQDKAKKLTNEDTINGLCGAVAILFELPSVTPQLSVPEVTALAEWIEKLTKECEEAYNKGYADGMKAQEPKTGHCKDCKWWKDSDGIYRRGVKAESHCPINRREVYEGNGYCFLYEPQESEEV